MTVFYVSPSGNDAWTGLQSSPSASNGPFATIARAQQAMRLNPGTDTVYIEGGTYVLTSPLTLTAADANSSFIGSPGQQVIISGGSPVSGWTVGTNGVWTAHVALSDVQQLVVDGTEQINARYPNFVAGDPIRGGWLWAKSPPAGIDPLTQMAFNPSDFTSGQPAVGEKVTVFDASGYATDVMTIAAVDHNTGVMTFSGAATYDIGAGSRYFVSSSQSFLDQPGEWYFDNTAQTLYFRPPSGFTGTGAVIAGGDANLVTVSNASNITIQGLTFSNATTTAVNDGFPTAAINLFSSTNITIDGNTFANVAQGITVDGVSYDNVISHNTFNHIWSAAVVLQPQTYQNIVTNNTISDTNSVFVQSGAIQLTETWGNVISHNSIQNVPRFGIDEINYDPSMRSGGNTIELNQILHSGQATPDVGAIYVFSNTDSAALGDIIRYNKIVDTGGLNTTATGFVPGQDFSWGIYLDNNASNAQVYSNFVSGTAYGGIELHGGINNNVYYNVLLNDIRYAIDVQDLGTPMTGTSIHDNVIAYSPGDSTITVDPAFESPATIYRNIYLSPTGAAPVIAEMTYEQWKALGGDVGSQVATSVGFVNAAGGDYSFQSGSVALAAGIPQLPWSQIGAQVACFAAGTRIATSRGLVAVEALQVGDMVHIVQGERVSPIVWLGHRKVNCRRHRSPADVWPVRIQAGAFGDGRPYRDLLLSPDHSVFVDGNLIPIRYLVNGRTICQEMCSEVTYWHVELDEHAVLYAEGVPSESYLDTGNRGAFANGGPVLDLSASFALRVWETQACAPLVVSGPVLETAKHRVLGWAKALGHQMVDNANLKVVAGDTVLDAKIDGSRWSVSIPDGTRTIRLVSRVWIPAHTRPQVTDERALGVAISGLCLDGHEVRLDDDVLSAGWYGSEPGWRWTDGDATLNVDGKHRVEFDLVMSGSYWLDEEADIARVA